MNTPVLKIKNISKQYKLGVIGSTSLHDDINRFFSKLRGKGDPYARIGDENIIHKSSKSKYAWALRDISFEVSKGDVVGIIGKNGAGKSTLLKVLSKITSPTNGDVKIKGQLASLLEVATGFHPEMTGRENIYLNGAILGMSKAKIKSKLNDIVEFSGCGRYIDTPVKRYSSGMYARLSFAVAAFLEADILLVDEVLAVGDADFQKRAIGKMQSVSQDSNRTILFVSHNMSAIKRLCNKCILLENGKLKMYGDTNKVIDEYLNPKNYNIDAYKGEEIFKGLFFKEFFITDSNNKRLKSISTGQTILFNVKLGNTINCDKQLFVDIRIRNKDLYLITTLTNWAKGDGVFRTFEETILYCQVQAFNLVPSNYFIDLVFYQDNEYKKLVVWNEFINIDVLQNDSKKRILIPEFHGNFILDYTWTDDIEKIR